MGKVQYYANFHPVFLSGPGNEDLFYSPSWNFAIKSTWILSDQFDIALSTSHLTITGRGGAVYPSWTNSSEKNLVQGFIHFIPSVTYRPVTNFALASGIRLGTANPIDPGNAKESSNSFLNTDISLTIQFMFKANERIQIGVDWIEGLTYYNYFEQQDPSQYYSFFKYRTFLIVCQYDFKM